MQALSYDSRALRGDLIRAGLGLALTVTPLILVPAHPIVFWALAIAAILFAIFLVRTLLRQNSTLHLDEIGMRVDGPLGQAIRWDELQQLKLRYFSTRRDRQHGWLQLSLKGSGQRLTIESTLNRFDDVVEQATEAAIANRLTLDNTTLENLAAMGVEVPEEMEEDHTPEQSRAGDDGTERS
jgi:hypothetical protein